MKSNKIKQWLFDPALFVMEAIRPPRTPEVPEGITSQQRAGLREYGEIIRCKMKKAMGESLSDEERKYAHAKGLSIQSAQGTGKDAFASWCVLHFMCTCPYPKILCTAPSGPQLDVVLWPEIHKWLRHSILQEVVVHQAEKVYLKEHQGKEWFAVKRTIQKHADPETQAETLAGLHEDYMIYVVDEASGVPDPVFRPIEGSMTGMVNFALVIFNPTKRTGYAMDTQQKHRDEWITLQWSGEDSELVPADLFSRDEAKYGRQSNWFRIRRLGLPPIQQDDAVIPWEWAEACTDLDLVPDPLDLRVAGLDVSGPGNDLTVLITQHGPKIESIEETTNLRTDEVAYWAHHHIMEKDIDAIAVDVIGLGAGVFDTLDRIGDVPVLAVNVCENAFWEPQRFFRLRDEVWWMLRERFEKRLISIPDNDELLKQITTPTYKDWEKKIKIEGKEHLRSRGEKSPDYADALCLGEYARRMFGRRKPQERRRRREREEAASWKVV
jgi:phage terminase large subunit